VVLGAILVKAVETAPSLVSVVRAAATWVARRPERHVRIEIEGVVLELTGASLDQQRQLLDSYEAEQPLQATASGVDPSSLRPSVDHPARQWFEPDPVWFKRAVFYEIHIRGFLDGNGDGWGDFRGLTDKLDYLQWFGIDCIWLLPFYESPLRDEGYDISDFTKVHDVYGTLEDVRAMIDAAHARRIRVIADLVVNHTSSDHPWFQDSRSGGPDGPKRDWYVWSDTDERYQDARIIFTDTETSNWSYDTVAGAYYWHRFFAHQPDLNYDNPQVHEAMMNVMRFWLDIGLDGLHLAGLPYLYEREGTNCENLSETHAYLKKLREDLETDYPDRVLVVDDSSWDETARDCGSAGVGLVSRQTSFPARLFAAVRHESREGILNGLRRPASDNAVHLAYFLRDHDQLMLASAPEEELDYLYAEYAKDPQMKLNLGIRRRLAPLLDNSRDEIQLMMAILFSLPGSPVLYYGDEVGMGDNIFLGDRDGMRTPMQWTGDRNGGFSRADLSQLYRPALQDPVYGFQSVSVEAQLRTQTSLLRWMHRFIALRKEEPALAIGTLTPLYPSNRGILAFVRSLDDTHILFVSNLTRSAQVADLDLTPWEPRVPIEVMGRVAFPKIDGRLYRLTLTGRGFLLFGLERRVSAEPFDGGM
jgi:maltose alpha-D-glucosyltransferase / alpha-amylase